MYIPLPVLAAMGVLFLGLLLLAFRRRGGSRDLIAPPRAGTLPEPMPGWPGSAAPIDMLPDEVEAQARALAAAGEKLEAIKLIRAATGLGLSEAKTLVERL